MSRVDFRRPVQAVIPGAQGKILALLAGASDELSLRTIARLTELSPAQVSRVLPGLVHLGMVERRDVPPSMLFRLVHEHVASRAIMSVARSRDAVLDELTRLAAEISPTPASLVIYGSFARGETEPEGDIDVLVVRPGSGSNDDDEWTTSLERWRQHVVRLSGNEVQILDVDEPELATALRSDRPLWRNIRREGVLVAGRPLSDLDDSIDA